MDKNKIAVTPPMGWNSYDYYDTTVTEEQVLKNAEFLAEHLKKFGYEYVVIDIEWYCNNAGTKRDKYQYIPFDDVEIDEYSRLQPSTVRFPSSKGGKGFKPLADKIHALGLKFGIHIMRGIPRNAAHNHLKILGTTALASDVADPSSICGWNPDMYGVRHNPDGQAYYDSIIAMYADWGVDFIKCDDICDSWLYPHPGFSGWEETKMLRKAIDKCGRPIVLSLSPGPAHVDNAMHYTSNANMWRITDDFWDNWKHLKNMFWRCEQWQDHVREGCWPDCDMLPVGKLGKGHGHEWYSNFNDEELKTMMTLWCIFRSPLMIGTDLPQIDEKTFKVLTNPDILEMLHDGRGVEIRRTADDAVWKSVGGSSARVAIFNLSDGERTIEVSKNELFEDARSMDSHMEIEYSSSRELWGEENCAVTESSISATVPPHGVRIFCFKRKLKVRKFIDDVFAKE